jgi:hypothetical protein
MDLLSRVHAPTRARGEFDNQNSNPGFHRALPAGKNGSLADSDRLLWEEATGRLGSEADIGEQRKAVGIALASVAF